MKCSKCNGTGIDDDRLICYECSGKGIVNQTNEEWFTSLSTEKKAEWLTNNGFLTCTLRDCNDCKYYDRKNDDCTEGYEAAHDKTMWVDWLKEVHHEKA